MRQKAFSWKTALAIGFTGMLTSGIWSVFNMLIRVTEKDFSEMEALIG